MSEATKAVFLSYAREDTDAAKRIADAYEVKATRIEPVGVAYLWPTSG